MLKRILNPVDEPEERPIQPEFRKAQSHRDSAQAKDGCHPSCPPAQVGFQNTPPSTQDVDMLDAPAAYSRLFREGAATQPDVNAGYQNDVALSSVSQGLRPIELSSPEASASCSDNNAIEKEEVICYGMIPRIDVRLIGNMSNIDRQIVDSVAANPLGTYQRFGVSCHSEPRHVQLSFPEGLKFGQLRQRDGENLEKLLADDRFGVELEATASTSQLREIIGKAKTNSDAMVSAGINVYGPRSRADDVGEMLSSFKMFLQPPDHTRSVPYHNPHTLSFPDLAVAQVQPAPADSNRRANDTASQPAKDIQDYLNESVFPKLRRNARLRQREGALAIKTSLLPHQRKALDFMMQRETGEIDEHFVMWKESTMQFGRKGYQHQVTKEQSKAHVDERGGGILADEMGLGKSLSIIALIIERAPEGRTWAGSSNMLTDTHGRIKAFSRATLVMVSSALLVNDWEQEIQRHLRDPGRVSVVRYQGSRGNIKLETLKDADIVVTTYSTLATEYANGLHRSLLHSVRWYRVVLDEAHYIQRQATTFYRACHDVEAEARWCLTGTPIQNRLDDIGALFAFVRIRPFDNLAVFRTHVSNLYEQGGGERKRATENLIALMDSLCLRRMRDDKPRQILRPLEFTPQEWAQYGKTEKTLGKTMGQRMGECTGWRWNDVEAARSLSPDDSCAGSHLGPFQASLQLRLVCNHGTFQQPFTWRTQSRRDLTEAKAVDPKTAQSRDRFCNGCGIIVATRIDSSFSTACGHLLCSECRGTSAHRTDKPAQPGCPLCRAYGQVPFGDEDDNEVHGDQYFRQGGYSTKMDELVKDIRQDLEMTKSIVFSCWTRTLTLISRSLRRANVPHEKIDGACSLLDYRAKLNRFADSDGTRVLIMTTDTAAFGLHLTCVNRVFIVEPQWNPSVEKQAVSRAVRLGQAEKVTVTRYYVCGTVEQDMVRHQEASRWKMAKVGNPSSRDADAVFVQ